MSKHPHQITVITGELVEVAWKKIKSVRHPRYTKTAYLENMAREGYYVCVIGELGYPIAIWMARAGEYEGESVAFVELTWHDGSSKGRYALTYIGLAFMVALEPHTKIMYYSQNNPWRQSYKAGSYYIFDTSKTMEEIWAATIQ